MREFRAGPRRPEKARGPFGRRERGDQAIRVGKIEHPRWTRKLIRMITRVFRG